MIEGVKITTQKIIPLSDGYIYHSIKSTDNEFKGFGEAYFSVIEKDAIRAWKQHLNMTLNIVVPCGAIRFVMYDSRKDSPTLNQFTVIELSIKNYVRLTVPPLIWMGFQGLDKNFNMLMNIADLLHDPSEVIRKDITEIKFDWSSRD